MNAAAYFNLTLFLRNTKAQSLTIQFHVDVVQTSLMVFVNYSGMIVINKSTIIFSNNTKYMLTLPDFNVYWPNDMKYTITKFVDDY